MLYIPFIVFVMLAMTNAVNLTDGLDGLASGSTAFISLFFAVAGMIIRGVCRIVFLQRAVRCMSRIPRVQQAPGRVFMGDTGSLALGGGLAAAAIVMKLELLLPITGLLYVIEALSVVIQVGISNSAAVRGSSGWRLYTIISRNADTARYRWWQRSGYSRYCAV